MASSVTFSFRIQMQLEREEARKQRNDCRALDCRESLSLWVG